jgi:peptide/nickel transport system permease protein
MNGFAIYAIKRFGQFVFVVFTGITLAFLVTHLSPIDPIEQTVSLLTNFGASDPRSVEVLRQ